MSLIQYGRNVSFKIGKKYAWHRLLRMLNLQSFVLQRNDRLIDNKTFRFIFALLKESYVSKFIMHAYPQYPVANRVLCWTLHTVKPFVVIWIFCPMHRNQTVNSEAVWCQPYACQHHHNQIGTDCDMANKTVPTRWWKDTHYWNDQTPSWPRKTLLRMTILLHLSLEEHIKTSLLL